MSIFMKYLLGFTRNSFIHMSEICDLKVLAYLNIIFITKSYIIL